MSLSTPNVSSSSEGFDNPFSIREGRIIVRAIRYDANSDSFVLDATSGICSACFKNFLATPCSHGGMSPMSIPAPGSILFQNEAVVSSSSEQSPLAGRVTLDASSGLRLRFRLPLNKDCEEQPPQKRRRIENEPSPALSSSFMNELEELALSSSTAQAELPPELPSSFADEMEDDSFTLISEVEELQEACVEDEDSVFCDSDEEVSPDTGALAPSSLNSPPVEEAQESSLPIDEEDSSLLALFSELAVLARAASIATLKEMVNVDLDQFKRLVTTELESQDKLSDAEWREIFIDAVRKKAFDAVKFLLQQSCIDPRIQVEGAREAVRAGDSWIAFAIMTIGTMSPESEVEQFLEEAASMGHSNLIRLALIKGWVTDALANELIAHSDKLKTNLVIRLAEFDIKKPLRGELLVKAVEAEAYNKDLAEVLLKNNALVRPSHRGKAVRIALEKKNYDALEKLLNTKQLITKQEMKKILPMLKGEKDPRVIAFFSKTFGSVEECQKEYQQLAASLQ